MAYPRVKGVESGLNTYGSNNGCKRNYAECNEVVENGGLSAEAEPHHLTKSYRPRKRKRGSPFTPAEFWQYVQRGSAADCWLWQDRCQKHNGYGVFWYPVIQKTTPAHRVAWVLTHGPVLGKLCILHKCDEPRCCNPRHLFLGTQLDNMRDMDAKGRRSPHAHSPKGRPWSPEQRRKMMIARRRRSDEMIAARERRKVS